MIPEPQYTEVYKTYWLFAAERQATYCRRLASPVGPWSDDPIISKYRFTNVYRVTDRVSQYLVKNVQYDKTRAQHRDELFFRTMLFKIFNKIETWEAIEAELGPISWLTLGAQLYRVSNVLSNLVEAGKPVYSAAYIMPAPKMGHTRKYDNHLDLLYKMMIDGLPSKLVAAPSLKAAYELILAYPGMDPFLAFQYCIDLNYSTLMDFDEADFVVAGPGALDGISKCFSNAKSLKPTDVIQLMVDRQDYEFDHFNVKFEGLLGRKLQPIDCQNLFCEISKYARVSHPHILGKAGRTKIKQEYKSRKTNMEPLFLPPKWGINL